MDLLNKAIILATTFHEGQLDKGGSPYILHPLRVMLSAKTDEERIVAVLHDTIEDTALTFDDLRNDGFDENIIDAIDHLTRRKGETYEEFILRAKSNPVARMVKIYDIKDNMDMSRIKNPTEQDYRRRGKYSNALLELTD